MMNAHAPRVSRGTSALAAPAVAFAMWATLGGCRIERVSEDGQDLQPASQEEPVQVPVRDTSQEAPLTPFRSLLQGAWATGVEERWSGAAEAPPQALAGLLIMVAAGDDSAAQRVATNLCVALRKGTEPVLALEQVMAWLECRLAVDPTSLREALVATSEGDWGAAVGIPPSTSAFGIADLARKRGLGFVVARPPGEGQDDPLTASTPAEPQLGLHCEDSPPLAIADLSGRLSPGAAALDAGLALGDEDAGIDAAQQDPEPVAAELRSKLVFAAVRAEDGSFAAAASAATVDADAYASAGVVALPSRRLMVGPLGVVLVDPALRRQVVPDPSAALRAYDALQRGEAVEDDVLWLRGSGGKHPQLPGLVFLHFDSTDPEARCSVEVTR